jgi:hypothetical protein
MERTGNTENESPVRLHEFCDLCGESQSLLEGIKFVLLKPLASLPSLDFRAGRGKFSLKESERRQNTKKKNLKFSKTKPLSPMESVNMPEKQVKTKPYEANSPADGCRLANCA